MSQLIYIPHSSVYSTLACTSELSQFVVDFTTEAVNKSLDFCTSAERTATTNKDNCPMSRNNVNI